MKPVIYLQPAEGWTYHNEERKRLEEELVEIASNEGTKTSVYMTDEGGRPYLYVYRDDKKIFQSECATQYETERNLRVVYAQYINQLHIVGNIAPDDTDKEDEDADLPPFDDINAMSETEFKEYCDKREAEITEGVVSLIEILTEDKSGALEFGDKEDESLESITDQIVEFLAIKCGFCIRRPMELMDDDHGLMVRTEYPYEEFEFGDGELSVEETT